MLLLVTIALAVVTVPALVVATWPTRRRRHGPLGRSNAGPIVLPVVTAAPRIEEFAVYAGYGDRVVLSLAADARPEVVAAAELVAGWYGFQVRACSADGAASSRKPGESEAAA